MKKYYIVLFYLLCSYLCSCCWFCSENRATAVLFFIYLGLIQAGGAVAMTFSSVCLAVCCSLLFQDTSLGRGTQNSLFLVPPRAGITTNPQRIFTIFTENIRNICDLGYQNFNFLSVDLNLSFQFLVLPGAGITTNPREYSQYLQRIFTIFVIWAIRVLIYLVFLSVDLNLNFSGVGQ